MQLSERMSIVGEQGQSPDRNAKRLSWQGQCADFFCFARGQRDVALDRPWLLCPWPARPWSPPARGWARVAAEPLRSSALGLVAGDVMPAREAVAHPIRAGQRDV